LHIIKVGYANNDFCFLKYTFANIQLKCKREIIKYYFYVMGSVTEDLCKLLVVNLINIMKMFYEQNLTETNEQVKVSNLIMVSSQLYTLLLSNSEKELYETICAIIVKEFNKYQLHENAVFFTHFVKNKQIMTEMVAQNNKKGGGLFSFFKFCAGILTMGIFSDAKQTTKDTLVDNMVEMKRTPSLATSVFNFGGTCVTNSLIFEMVCRGVPNANSPEVNRFYETAYESYTARQQEDISRRYYSPSYNDLSLETPKIINMKNFTRAGDEGLTLSYSNQIKTEYKEYLLNFPLPNREDNVIVSTFDVNFYSDGTGGYHALNLFTSFEREENGNVIGNSLKLCVSDADKLVNWDPYSRTFVFSTSPSIFCEEGVFSASQLDKLGSMVQVVQNPLDHYVNLYTVYPKDFQTPANATSESYMYEPYTKDMNTLVDIFDGLHTQIVRAIFDASNDAPQEHIERAGELKKHFDRQFNRYPNYNYQTLPHTDTKPNKNSANTNSDDTTNKVLAAAVAFAGPAALALIKKAKDKKQKDELEAENKGGNNKTKKQKKRRKTLKRRKTTTKNKKKRK